MSEATKQISLGTCPTCGGPAQFIEGGNVRHVGLRSSSEPRKTPDVDSVGNLTRQAVRMSLYPKKGSQ